MVRAVVFDLDDTLAPERLFIKSGYQTVARFLAPKTNLSGDEIFDRLMSLFSESSANVFNRLYESLGMKYAADDIIGLVQLYRDHKPDPNIYQMYEDAKNILEQLANKQVQLGLLTDGYAHSQRNKIAALEIASNFSNIIVTDELGRDFWKPDIRPFELMQKQLQLPFEEICYVGDNPKKDFYISKFYPIQTVRVVRDDGVYHHDDYLEGIRESLRIENLTQLLKAIF